jgi:thiosulfate reductase cytochrome b subunit
VVRVARYTFCLAVLDAVRYNVWASLFLGYDFCNLVVERVQRDALPDVPVAERVQRDVLPDVPFSLHHSLRELTGSPQ